MSIDAWRTCSSCRTSIDFGATYWVCSVSTCNKSRIPLFFCSVPCWEAHLPTMRHREAFAVEKRAPTREQAAREEAEAQAAPAGPPEESTKRRVVATAAATASADDDALPREVLIVASKLKKYIKARSGMNTSDRVVEALSDIVRSHCNDAIRRAAEEGRKTVLDRDFAR